MDNYGKLHAKIDVLFASNRQKFNRNTVFLTTQYSGWTGNAISDLKKNMVLVEVEYQSYRDLFLFDGVVNKASSAGPYLYPADD